MGTGERMMNAAEIIRGTLQTNPVVAVVSAMSSTIKTEGTTTLLLEACNRAGRGVNFDDPLEKLERNHVAAVREAVKDKALVGAMETFISEELTRLKSFLEALAVIREVSPRSQDMVMASGERMSAHLLATVLQDMGVEAEAVDLAHVVPETVWEVTPGLFRELQQIIGGLCTPTKTKVPVVTGFFGQMPGGLLKSVGRGYTDFTAALISAGLGREKTKEMQVWKEVDGIFTADPRKVPKAKVLDRITPAEAAELTYFGSEVLHPFTMEQVVDANIPIRMKNTFHPEGEGTLILPGEGNVDGGVTAVTAKGDITVFSIQSNRMFNAHGFMARVFQVLANHNVVVDLIATSEVSISCTVDQTGELHRAKKDLENLGTVAITPGKAILAMVGEGMKFSVGTAGKMFSTLGAAGVNIEMISQGASEINISCVVAEKDVETGLKSIHGSFLEGE